MPQSAPKDFDDLPTSFSAIAEEYYREATKGGPFGEHGAARLLWGQNVLASAPILVEGEEECGQGEQTRALRQQAENELRKALGDVLAGGDTELQTPTYEVGQGAQGFDMTLFVAIGGFIAVPLPTAIIAWSKAIPLLKGWLRKYNGRPSLALAKQFCLDDARGRVKYPDALSLAHVGGHCLAIPLESDIVPVGPFSVSIWVEEKEAVFVYTVNDVGDILHFHEIPQPGVVAPDM